jgi:TolB-like protein
MPITACRAIAAALVLSAGTLAQAQPVIASNPALVNERATALVQLPYAYEPIQSMPSRSGAGVFNSGMIFLADQIDRNGVPEARKRMTVVTSFSNLTDLTESSNFGRLVGEHMLHELQVRGWTVTDMRLTRNLVVNESGEFSLSRDIKRIRENLPAGNVLTGTYSLTPDGVLLNARVIDLATGEVLSTAQTRFAQDRFISSLVDKPRALPIVNLAR